MTVKRYALLLHFNKQWMVSQLNATPLLLPEPQNMKVSTEVLLASAYTAQSQCHLTEKRTERKAVETGGTRRRCMIRPHFVIQQT
jgi:hypothetical protein